MRVYAVRGADGRYFGKNNCGAHYELKRWPLPSTHLATADFVDARIYTATGPARTIVTRLNKHGGDVRMVVFELTEVEGE